MIDSNKIIDRIKAKPGSSSISVGDRVTVKSGANHDDMTKDATGTVVSTGGEALAIQFDNMDKVHKWYVASELEKE